MNNEENDPEKVDLKCTSDRIWPEQCDWSGDTSSALKISDHGFISGVWWYVSWHCPKCKTKLGEVNQNSNSSNKFFNLK